jgi:hypothetical protein
MMMGFGNLVVLVVIAVPILVIAGLIILMVRPAIGRTSPSVEPVSARTSVFPPPGG